MMAEGRAERPAEPPHAVAHCAGEETGRMAQPGEGRDLRARAASRLHQQAQWGLLVKSPGAVGLTG